MQKIIDKITEIIFVSVINLHINGLYSLFERPRMAEWIIIQNPNLCHLQNSP